ncbi:hypothetical protein ACHQM5_000541 [Ranunculus cassubicifolius]
MEEIRRNNEEINGRLEEAERRADVAEMRRDVLSIEMVNHARKIEELENWKARLELCMSNFGPAFPLRMNPQRCCAYVKETPPIVEELVDSFYFLLFLELLAFQISCARRLLFCVVIQCLVI